MVKISLVCFNLISQNLAILINIGLCQQSTACKVQYSTVQYSTIQYNTIQYSTIQYNTVQYNTVQYSTIQYKYNVQYSTDNTIQYSTIQYSDIPLVHFNLLLQNLAICHDSTLV